jgi:Na+/H+-dicarboxylate symporter
MFISKWLLYWFRLASWKQIIVGLVAGIIVGLIFGNKATILLPFGQVFIHGIQMLVVPVVATAIICAVTVSRDLSRVSRSVVKALIIYAATMSVAATIGILVANVMGVGFGISLATSATQMVTPHTLSFGEVLVNFVPSSPFQAFAANNVMQILCFSLLFGIAIRLVGPKAQPVKDLFVALSEVVFKFARIILSFAPYGIFALIACVFGQYGASAFLPLIKFIASVYVSCFLLLLVFASILLIYRIAPLFFYRGVSSALITAFTTSSSAATLPVSMRCARENLKLDSNLSDFLLPLGVTLNLNGLAIYLSTAVIFAAHIYGVTLELSQYISIVITIVLTAMGAAAVPGSALIVMGAVMNSVGIPLGALPLIAGVDRFNDMAQTMTNVAGDLFSATVVAKSEGLMNSEKNIPKASESIEL